jgi:predicted small lipoprotein YifL
MRTPLLIFAFAFALSACGYRTPLALPKPAAKPPAATPVPAPVPEEPQNERG